MIGFWISAGAMVLMVALFLGQALRQGRGQLAPGGHSDLAVYRDQLTEVERDLARGVLAPAEAERLRLEVQRRMLDADRRHREPTRAGQGALPLGLAAVMLSLGTGVALYFDLGVPGYPDLPLSERLALADQAYLNRPSQDQAEAAQPAYAAPNDLDPSLAAMIDQLRAAVASRPDDLQGQVLLARNETALGNFAAARRAQAEVVRLKGDAATAGDNSALAQLMVTAAGGAVTPEAEAVLVQTLRLDPGNAWARYYSGLMFAETGRPDHSFALWEPLLREGPPDAPWIPPISALIAEVASAAGIAYTAPARGPDAAAVAAASALSDTDRQAMIAGMVAGLEQRLSTAGGPVEDWVKLITSLGVLQQTTRAKVAYRLAQTAFAGQPAPLAALNAAARKAGVTP